MKLRCNYQDKSVDELIVSLKETGICPFKDSLCPIDVMKKYPSKRVAEGCEYCIRKYSGKS